MSALTHLQRLESESIHECHGRIPLVPLDFAAPRRETVRFRTLGCDDL